MTPLLSEMIEDDSSSGQDSNNTSYREKLLFSYASKSDVAVFHNIGNEHADAIVLMIIVKSKSAHDNIDAVKSIPITDEDFSQLGALKRLEKLFISSIPFRGHGLRYITSKKLGELSVSSCTIADDFFASFSHLTALETLIVENRLRTLSAPDLRGLSANHSLRLIDLSYCYLSDSAFDHFPELPKLETLALEENLLTGENFHFICGLKKLGFIDLRKNPLTNAGIEVIVQNAPKKLNSLSLMDCPNANDEWMRHISRMNQLKTLFFKNAHITDASLPYFQNMQNLETIFLDGCDISLKACKAIHETCPKMTIGLPDGKELESKRNRRIRRKYE